MMGRGPSSASEAVSANPLEPIRERATMTDSAEGYVKVRYIKDFAAGKNRNAARLVEMPMGVAHQKIAAGEMFPVPDHTGRYEKWCTAENPKADLPEIPVAAIEEEAKTDEDPATDGDDSAALEEEAAEPEAEVDTDGLPKGYSIEHKGPWYTAIGPEGEKIGKAQKDRRSAELLTKAHAKEAKVK